PGSDGLLTRRRERTWYQPLAVPANASVVSSANATAEPRVRVTGASTRPAVHTEVLAMRLTPCGALIQSVKKGSRRARRVCASLLSIHWKNSWSATLPANTRRAGLDHRPPVTKMA